LEPDVSSGLDHFPQPPKLSLITQTLPVLPDIRRILGSMT